MINPKLAVTLSLVSVAAMLSAALLPFTWWTAILFLAGASCLLRCVWLTRTRVTERVYEGIDLPDEVVPDDDAPLLRPDVNLSKD